MINNSTIYALATPPGKSGVAVLRMSGEDAFEILSKLIKQAVPKPRIATLCKIYKLDSDNIIDEALVLCFKAPHSFTGEDIVELQLHGSNAVISAMLEILSGYARLAEPGEFSRRALHNNKLDLAEAEGLADLIDSETESQRLQAINQFQGTLSTQMNEWRDSLIQLMAEFEAYIDFPDEPLPEKLDIAATDKALALSDKIENMLSIKSGEIIRNGIKIAILGAPNVGKSSLFNCLAQRDAAIVTDIAGTTRDVLEVTLDINGIAVKLLDTAGLRASDDKVERIGINRAHEQAKQADLLLLMANAKDYPDMPEDLNAFTNKSHIWIYNKSDSLSSCDEIPHQVRDEAVIISTKDNTDIDKLISAIKAKITNIISQHTSSSAIITRTRHRQHLDATNKALMAFSISRVASEPAELSVEHLRIAATELGAITGHIGVEDILDKLFSSFCIGK